MPIAPQRWAIVATLVLLLLSTVLVQTGSAAPASGGVINVVVRTAGGGYGPAGLDVTLTVGATGHVCVEQTTTGGLATFQNGAVDVNGNPCYISAGWFTVRVAAQVDSNTGTSSSIAAFPGSGSSQTFNLTSSQIGTTQFVYLSGLTTAAMTNSLSGSISVGGGGLDFNTTSVQVLDPAFPGLVLASGTDFTSRYSFSNDLPTGTWTLYAFGALADGQQVSNYSSVVVSGGHNTYDVNVSDYLVTGLLAPVGEHGAYSNQTNVTLYDLTNSHVYSFNFPSKASNYFFQLGSYSTLVSSPTASTQFLLLVSPQGYQPTWRYFTAAPGGNTQNFVLPVDPWTPAPPTVQSTSIGFNATFDSAWVNSTADLGNGSVVNALPNAAIGDLYAQVGADFNGGALNGSAPAWTAFQNWLELNGPVYPADQEGLAVNGTAFTETGNYHFAPGAAPADLTFASTDSFTYATQEAYGIASTLTDRTSTHTLTVGFRYPSSTEALTYTVSLPAGWVLTANSYVPVGTTLTAAGPGGTWSAFTLSALHSSWGAQNGTAIFNVTKVQKVTVAVNVNSPNFAFSNKTNILNDTHDNYTVLVGGGLPWGGQNVSFSASDSVFPAGFNATSYFWNFGDASTQTTYRENTSVHHVYSTAGKFSAYVLLTANGGQTSQQNFTVYVGNLAPTAKITSNDTRGLLTGLGAAKNDSLLWVNWSQSVQLNATKSTSTIASGLPPGSPAGRLSDAIWNISAKTNPSSTAWSGATYYGTNFSIGAQAASVFGNVTYQFRGAGTPNVTWNIDGTQYKTKGSWLYRAVLKLYDAGGNVGYSTLYIVVNDTEPPLPVGAVQGGTYFSPAVDESKNVTSGVELSSGVCPISLVDKWSSAPNNSTLAHYSWEISNPSFTGYNTWYRNSSSDNSSALVLKVPTSYSSSSGAPYFLNLSVKDIAGNVANVTYRFTCALNTTISPILYTIGMNVSSTLTQGQKYTIFVNVTNVGGSLSTANLTHVQFYYTNPSGGGLTNISWGTLYGFYGGIVNSTAEPGVTQANLHFNVSYRAVVSWTVPAGGLLGGGLAPGSYRICANATSYNEFVGSYKTLENIACTTVTINASDTAEIVLGIVISVVIIVVLALVYFVYRRRSKGGAKKVSSGKGRKEEEEEEDEDEEDERPKGGKGKDEDDE